MKKIYQRKIDIIQNFFFFLNTSIQRILNLKYVYLKYFYVSVLLK